MLVQLKQELDTISKEILLIREVVRNFQQNISLEKLSEFKNTVLE